jgi:hypothetical protein
VTFAAGAHYHGSQRPCPDCDRAMIPHDRWSDVCRNCGLIAVNEERAFRMLRRIFGGHRIYRDD